MDETKSNSDLLVPLGVLVTKSIHLFKASDEIQEDNLLNSDAPNIIPFVLRVLNVDIWAELVNGRPLCTERFLGAREVFNSELNNLVNTVV